MPSIIEQSFAIIDSEFGDHSFSLEEYAIVRRTIHATADFEFKQLVRFGPEAIAGAIAALREGVAIVCDTQMVERGVATLAARTFGNPTIAAVTQVEAALPGKTRTETGILHCLDRYPEAIYAIGNAPTALLALCDRAVTLPRKPALVVGAPVGFVSVVESKAALARTDLPQIRVDGRKGGSPATSAIVNALLCLAAESAS